MEAAGFRWRRSRGSRGRAGVGSILRGRVVSPDGGTLIEVDGEAPAEEAGALGRRLAAEAMKRGAAALLGGAGA